MPPSVSCSPASLKSTDVTNCTYLLVYYRYIDTVELKHWVLHVRKSRDE